MIHHGDLFVVLPTLPEASIDACVTDPPYGIGFMGKQWDTFRPGVAETRIVENKAAESDNPNLRGRSRRPASSPSAVEYDRSLKGQREFQAWCERWAREVYRVLKPGAHLLVCGAPRSAHRMVCGIEDAGFNIRDSVAWITGQGFPKSRNLGDGWGTALKPGHEPIVVARKPFRGSVEKNHATYGTGGLNVDACRIGNDDTRRMKSGGPGQFPHEDDSWEPKPIIVGSDSGRWPANAAFDEDAAAELDRQSGELTSGAIVEGRAAGTNFSQARKRVHVYDMPADSGGASRFFYVAKPSRAERDMGCHNLPPRQRDESRKVGNPGGDNPRNRGLQPRGNHHPTVKPIALMRWLVRLVTPVGGTVLDPFAGSGTTGCACAFEGFQFIGIEREAEYVEIAERRIAACVPLFGVPSDPLPLERTWR